MRLSHLLVGVVFVLLFAMVPTASAQRGEGKAGERGEAGEREGKDDAEDKAGAAGMGMGAGGMAGGVNLLMQALDTDGDGELSAKEIKSAAKSLKQLDGNKDGKLTPDETGAGALMGMLGGAGAAGAGGAGAAGAGGAGGAAGAGGAGGAAGAGGAGGAAGAGGAGGGGAAGGGFGGRGGPGAGGFGGAGAPAAGGFNGGASGFAQPPGAGLPPQTSQLMGFDKNQDRKLSREELPERFQVLFERLDLDRDGSIDVRELRAAAEGAPRAAK